MQLKPVVTVEHIGSDEFRKEFYEPGIPVVIKNLSKVPLKKNRGRNISMERITVNIFLEESLCRPIALNINQR